MLLDAQQYLRKKFKEEFHFRCFNNEQYSLRAFAKNLNTSSSSLSEFFNGKRNLSLKMAEKYCKQLAWPESEVEFIKGLFENQTNLSTLNSIKENKLEENIISENQLEVMFDWRYFAVIAVLRLKDFRPSKNNIAKKLGLDVKEVGAIVEKLIDFEMVKLNSLEEVVDLKKCYRTPETFPDDLLFKRLLEATHGINRSIKDKNKLLSGNFATVSVDVSRLTDAEKLIEEFLKKLCLFLSEGNEKSEVMELDIFLYPRTQN